MDLKYKQELIELAVKLEILEIHMIERVKMAESKIKCHNKLMVDRDEAVRAEAVKGAAEAKQVQLTMHRLSAALADAVREIEDLCRL